MSCDDTFFSQTSPIHISVCEVTWWVVLVSCLKRQQLGKAEWESRRQDSCLDPIVFLWEKGRGWKRRLPFSLLSLFSFRGKGLPKPTFCAPYLFLLLTLSILHVISSVRKGERVWGMERVQGTSLVRSARGAGRNVAFPESISLFLPSRLFIPHALLHCLTDEKVCGKRRVFLESFPTLLFSSPMHSCSPFSRMGGLGIFERNIIVIGAVFIVFE